MKTKTSPIRNSMNGAPVQLMFLVIPIVLACFIKSASAQAPIGYTRIQLKHGGQYLDAAYCGKTITLNPGSNFEGGACELWRFVPAGGGRTRFDVSERPSAPPPRIPRPTPTRKIPYGNDNQAEEVHP